MKQEKATDKSELICMAGVAYVVSAAMAYWICSDYHIRGIARILLIVVSPALLIAFCGTFIALLFGSFASAIMAKQRFFDRYPKFWERVGHLLFWPLLWCGNKADTAPNEKIKTRYSRIGNFFLGVYLLIGALLLGWVKSLLGIREVE